MWLYKEVDVTDKIITSSNGTAWGVSTTRSALFRIYE